MKVAIIGGGSIGLLFAYYLSDKYDVTLYTRTEQQTQAILDNGIHIMTNGITHRKWVNSKCVDYWQGMEELTFIAVKQYHLEQFINDTLNKNSRNTKLIFLQNGMGHLKLLENLDSTSVYVSTVEHGVFKKNNFSVSHNGIGLTKISLYKGEETLPSTIFSISNFPIVLEEDFYSMLVRKLIINAIINPLTALLRITNGQIIENMYYLEAAKGIFREVAEVLELENRESYFQQVLDVCHKTAKNRSSMLKDIEQNRQTEIEAIIGYILEEAEKKEKKAPICQMLFDLIKGSEIGRSNDG
ncbi:2-dehydropantoate 2-reductase [Pseudoneobacillus sp. C159]